MADVHDQKTRSFNMSRIGSRNTKPELIVRKYLHAKGFRYRMHDRKLPGHPDIILPKYKTVVFVHGCFWHGHDHCRYFVVPKTKTEWWVEKINRNKERDKIVANTLRELGWQVLTIWECELKKNRVEETLANLPGKIKANQ